MRTLKYTVLWTAYRFYSQKVEKNTPKSSILKQKFGPFRNFSLLPKQPRWQISYSKIGPIEQQYIELEISVTHLILRFDNVQNKFHQTNKTKINHINDNHIKFEVSLDFLGDLAYCAPQRGGLNYVHSLLQLKAGYC